MKGYELIGAGGFGAGHILNEYNYNSDLMFSLFLGMY